MPLPQLVMAMQRARTLVDIISQLLMLDDAATVVCTPPPVCLLSLYTATWIFSLTCIAVSLLGWTKTTVLLRLFTLMASFTLRRAARRVSALWTRAQVAVGVRAPPPPLPPTTTATMPFLFMHAPAPAAAATAPPPTGARPVMRRPRPVDVAPAIPGNNTVEE